MFTYQLFFSLKANIFFSKVIIQNLKKIQMKRFYATLSQKRSLQKVMLNQLQSKQTIPLQYYYFFIASNIQTTRQLDHFLKIIKKLTLTPLTILKILHFIHAYLQTSKPIIQQTMISFINFLLFQCSNFIQNGKVNFTSKGIRNQIMRTEATQRQQQSILSKEILINNITKIYIRYLLKIISIYDDFNKINISQEYQSHFVWMMINLYKSVSSFSSNFTIIGRYFIKQYGEFVISMIEILTKDVNKLNNSLKHYILTQNYILSCCGDTSRNQIQELVKMLHQINSTNEILLHIYLGKYFYGYLTDIEQPEWINTNSNEFDTIFKIYSSYQQENSIVFKSKNIINDQRIRKIPLELSI